MYSVATAEELQAEKELKQLKVLRPSLFEERDENDEQKEIESSSEEESE